MMFTFFKSIVEIEAATWDLIVGTLNNKHTLTCVLDEQTCTVHAFHCHQTVALLCNKKEITSSLSQFTAVHSFSSSVLLHNSAN